MENETIEVVKNKGGRKKVYKDLVRTNIYLEREFLDLAKIIVDKIKQKDEYNDLTSSHLFRKILKKELNKIDVELKEKEAIALKKAHDDFFNQKTGD